MSFAISLDVTNPGQFFACCGLFELAERLSAKEVLTARFEGPRFVVDGGPTLPLLLEQFTARPLERLDPLDETSSPVGVPVPFDLRLDWWKDATVGGRDLKLWAGRMDSVRIAQAMASAIRDPRFHTEDVLDFGCVVYSPEDPTKKVEPFYFDARRAPNAHSRDAGFSADALGLTTTAFPATEVLCLVGLQRCRPSPTGTRRVFDYRTWCVPLPISVVASVVSGAVPLPGTRTYRFESRFRTEYNKAFRSAVVIERGG
jgi:CRISPR-associated protein Csx14